MQKSVVIQLVCLLPLLVLGCGGNTANVPVYTVHGAVKFNDKPMAGGGSIAFIPKNAQSGKTAGGEVKEDGTYTLSTYGDGDGSMAGEFRVVITQTVEEEPEIVPDGAGIAPKPTVIVPVKDRIPAKYSDYTASPLSAKVEPRSGNEINFALEPR
ncbi:MAG: hypothetical protein Q8K78_02510 [Planctomycetaceae bacterium]|nr:hypothetical protein [Planctomycetaceae bacterium]